MRAQEMISHRLYHTRKVCTMIFRSDEAIELPTRRCRWSAYEKARLRAEYGITPLYVLALDFGRAPKAIQMKAAREGVSAIENRSYLDAFDIPTQIHARSGERRKRA